MRDDDADGRPKTPVTHAIGCDLSTVSVDELRERVALLREEIARVEQEAERKLASRTAASAVFRT